MTSTFDQWALSFRAVLRRLSTEDTHVFLSLADEALALPADKVIPVLLESFLPIDDYGTQERVISVLAAFPAHSYIPALLSSLPAMLEHDSEWPEILVAQEVQFSPDTLLQFFNAAPPDAQSALRAVVGSDAFISEYDNAQKVWHQIKSPR